MYTSHPKLTSPADKTVIWRYMDFPKFISMLSTSSLYFRRIDTMDDKWEGCYPLFFHIDDPMINSFRDQLRQAQASIRKTGYVNCWHINNAGESFAMWKIYTLMGQGIAIRTNIRRFKKALLKTPTDVYIGKVKYGKFDNRFLNPTNNHFPIFALKWPAYKYEQEVRAIVSMGLPEAEAAGNGVTVSLDIKELIQRVILAPGAMDWLVETVKSLLKAYGMGHVPVEKSSLDKPPPS